MWWQRSNLIELLLQQALKQSALTSPSLSGLSFDFKQAQLSNIGFGLATPSGELSVALQDITAEYDLKNRTVNTLSIGRAEVKFHYQSKENTVTNATEDSAAISLPLNRLNIEKLEMNIDTPWGMSRFSGQADLERDATDLIEAKFQDAQQSIRLTIDPGFSAAVLSLERLPNGKVFELHTTQLKPPAKQLKLDAGALAFIDWFSTSLLIPDALRAKTPRSDISKLSPLLGSTQLSVFAQTPDNFATLTAGALLKRDKLSLLTIDMSMAQDQSLNVNGRLDMAATEAFELIKPWLPATAASWTLSGGAIQGNLALRRPARQDVSGSAQLDVSDLAMTAGAARIEKGSVTLHMPELADRTVDLSAEIPTLNLGKELAAGNLKINARYLDQSLTLNQASLAIFGGILELMPDKIQLEQLPIRLTLRLRSVDLSQLLASLHYPNISGTGNIDGELPLQLSAGSIDLQDGAVSGTRPGVLRYAGPVADSENIAFKALRNLVYQNLQAKVNYRPNGDYHLGLRLEGSNPEVLSGHPLAFNLNISGQLPELLQKGILAGDFERTILEQAAAKPKDVEKFPKPPAGNQQPKPPSAERRNQ